VYEVARQFNTQRKPHFEKRNTLFDQVPEFWPRVFANHPILEDLLEGEDMEIIKSLKCVNVEESTTEQADKHASNFKITFTFNKNPYFSNKTLWKQFEYNDEEEVTVTSSKINWNKGKNPQEKKKAQDEGKKAKRSHEDMEELDEDMSFFKWFEPEDQDDQLGMIIRDEVWPNPMHFWLGGDEFSDDEEDEDENGEGDE